MLDGIAALEHFVLVAQSERRVAVHTRTESGWELIAIEPPGDTIDLTALGATLSLEAVHEGSAR